MTDTITPNPSATPAPQADTATRLGFFAALQASMKAGDSMALTVVSEADGSLSVTLVPKGTFSNPALGLGLNLHRVQGTELDADLGGLLSNYTVARQTLREQVDAAAALLGKETKAVATQTASKLAEKAKKETKTDSPAQVPKASGIAPASPNSVGVASTAAPAAEAAPASVDLF